MDLRKAGLIFTVVPITGIRSTLPDFPLSKRELTIRAGYYTAGGKYLGGSPRYDNEWKLYECVELNSGSSATDGSVSYGSYTDISATDENATDGSATEGSTTGGHTTDESATDGSAIDGRDTGSSATGGRATDENASGRNATDGSATGGSATDGRATVESASESSVTEVSATTDGSEGDATVCMSWSASEAALAGHEGGMCFCQSITNGEYCSEWSCYRLDKNRAMACSRSGHDGCFSERTVKSTRCCCDAEEDDSRKFCASWTCVETDSKGTQVFEQYQCARGSPSAEYCEAWTGVRETSEEVEVYTCECLEELDGPGVCSYWECRQRGLDRCSHADPSWCNIRASIGVGGFVGAWGAMLVAFYLLRRDLPARFLGIAFGLLWMAGWSVGVVVWGGVDGAVYAGILWGAIIAWGSLYRIFNYIPRQISLMRGSTTAVEQTTRGE